MKTLQEKIAEELQSLFAADHTLVGVMFQTPEALAAEFVEAPIYLEREETASADDEEDDYGYRDDYDDDLDTVALKDAESPSFNDVRAAAYGVVQAAISRKVNQVNGPMGDEMDMGAIMRLQEMLLNTIARSSIDAHSVEDVVRRVEDSQAWQEFAELMRAQCPVPGIDKMLHRNLVALGETVMATKRVSNLVSNVPADLAGIARQSLQTISSISMQAVRDEGEVVVAAMVEAYFKAAA